MVERDEDCNRESVAGGGKERRWPKDKHMIWRSGSGDRHRRIFVSMNPVSQALWTCACKLDCLYFADDGADFWRAAGYKGRDK